MPYNGGMDANKIIDRLGGTNAVARLCEVEPASVSEWRTSKNGIPKARLMFLRLARPDAFESDEQRTESSEAQTGAPPR